MASPQVELGHVRVAHDLYQALARLNIPHTLRACTDCIIAHTYGWGRTWAPIGRQHFAEWTRRSPAQCGRALKVLLTARIIETDNTRRPAQWRIQKDY